MSLLTSSVLRRMQPKKKRCKRCSLYYTEKLVKCSHCGDLDTRGLQELIEKHDEEMEANKSLGRYFILGAVVLVVLLFLTLI